MKGSKSTHLREDGGQLLADKVGSRVLEVVLAQVFGVRKSEDDRVRLHRADTGNPDELQTA